MNERDFELYFQLTIEPYAQEEHKVARVRKVSAKGQVVIPEDLRRKYGIDSGDLVMVEDSEAGIRVLPLPRDPLRAIAGRLARKPGLEILRGERELKRDEERTRRLAGKPE